MQLSAALQKFIWSRPYVLSSYCGIEKFAGYVQRARKNEWHALMEAPSVKHTVRQLHCSFESFHNIIDEKVVCHTVTMLGKVPEVDDEVKGHCM